MKPKFWQTQGFKTLEKEWYTKLKENDFNDVEWEKYNGDASLKQWASNCYRTKNQLEIENRRLYYEALEHFLHKETEFKNQIENLIMLRRSQGTPYKRITEELATLNCRFTNRWTIRQIVKKYEDKWAIKRK